MRQLKVRLVTVADLAERGRIALLADTNVYINDAADNLPPAVTALLDRATLFHCAVCVSELTVGIANGDPGHAGWSATRDHYAELVASIPATRLFTPDPQVWAEAGIIAGTRARCTFARFSGGNA